VRQVAENGGDELRPGSPAAAALLPPCPTPSARALFLLRPGLVSRPRRASLPLRPADPFRPLILTAPSTCRSPPHVLLGLVYLSPAAPAPTCPRTPPQPRPNLGVRATRCPRCCLRGGPSGSSHRALLSSLLAPPRRSSLSSTHSRPITLITCASLLSPCPSFPSPLQRWRRELIPGYPLSREHAPRLRAHTFRSTGRERLRHPRPPVLPPSLPPLPPRPSPAAISPRRLLRTGCVLHMACAKAGVGERCGCRH